MSDLKLDIRNIDKHPEGKIISFIGVFGVNNVNFVSKEVDNIIKNGAYKLIFDASKLEYITSAGIGEMISYRRECAKRGGKICVACANENVMKVFSDSGFAKLCDFYETVDEAIENEFGKGNKK